LPDDSKLMEFKESYLLAQCIFDQIVNWFRCEKL